jgi:hypothetical protein
MWDIEVDVACIGAGVGGLASAIATSDAGGDVLVAIPHVARTVLPSGAAVQQRVGGILRSWAGPQLDLATREYFSALEDFAPSTRPEDARLTLRTARPMSSSGRVETFVGSAVLDWNAKCSASPYGMLSTMSRRPTTPMRASDGQSLDVQAIGSINSTELSEGSALSGWMAQRVRERDIDVRESCGLERIVFEAGRIVGVMIRTVDGPLAVGVRAGVVLTSSDPLVDSHPLPVSSPHDLQVCVVGQPASRFFRVELLDASPAESPVRPTCNALGRQLRVGLRASRTLRSDAGSCGKLR